MDVLISPYIEVIFNDIYNGLYNMYGQSLLSEYENFLSACRMDPQLGSKISNKAFRFLESGSLDIISGQTLCIELIKYILPRELLNKKETKENLEYGCNIIKDMYLAVVPNIILPYVKPILTRRGEMEHIVKNKVEEEVRRYIGQIKDRYKDKYPSFTPVGPDYKKMYEEARMDRDRYKTKYNSLKDLNRPEKQNPFADLI